MVKKKLIPATPAKTQARVIRAIERCLCSAACIDLEDTGERIFLYFNRIWKMSYVRKAASHLVGLYREKGPGPVFENDNVLAETSEDSLSLRDFLAANIEAVMMFYEEEAEGSGTQPDVRSGEMSPVLVSFLSKNSIPWPKFCHTEGLADTYKAPVHGSVNGIGRGVGECPFRRHSRWEEEEEKKISEITRSYFSSIKKRDTQSDNTKNSPSTDATDDKENGENIEDRRNRE